MGVSQNDIAEKAGVSRYVVSSVLSERPNARIASATRDRVLAAAREMGYRPNFAARALVTGRHNIIGLWMSHHYNPFHARMVDGLRQEAGGHGYELIIQDMAQFSHPHQESIYLAQWPVDGVFALDLLPEAGAVVRANLPPNIPFVNMGAYFDQEFDHIGIDLHQGSLEAMRYLFENGCKLVACLVPNWANHPGDPRRDAYLHSVEAAGQKPLFIETLDNRAEARRTVRDRMSHSPMPDGIFCYNDILAIGVNRGLFDLGREVAESVLITGCDGIEELEYLERPISTIVQPVEEMCKLGWEFLLNRIQCPSLPVQSSILQPYFQVNESTQ